ncbi:AsmA family protein [Odoribacter sp. OttesenSCG-928-G04]|nr:AsmA family protein [Odoribacter sp. OttesenSCG-928-G04]
MKKFFAIFGAVIVVILLTLILIPVVFKGDIIRIIEEQSAKYIKADLSIGDVNLSMFRSFPDLNVEIQNVEITGKEEFQGDTLIALPLLSASVNLKSLISGDELVINHILLKDARISATVLASGKANWDVVINTGEERTENKKAEETGSSKGLKLNDISIENLYLAYNDHSSSIYASITDTDLNLSGNFSETNTLLNISLDLNDISVRQANTVWVSRTDLHWVSEIAANFKEMTFGIHKNSLALNDLKLDLNGHLAVLPDRYKMDISLSAPDTRFESLLAMLPKSFQHYIKDIKTDGEFTLSAQAKGEMYEDNLPAFQVMFKINNAYVQYPELPEAVKDINVDFELSNPGGKVEGTVIDLKHLGFAIAGNPFKVALQVRDLNDMMLDGSASGMIDFAGLKKALPIEVTQLQGIMTTDITMNGKYRYIEEQKYERFNAKGSVVLKDFLFASKDFPQGISIPQGNLQVSPVQLSLNNFRANINSSDFTLNGNITHYLPYILKGETLKGQFSLHSNRINLNEFMAVSGDNSQAKQEEEVTPNEASASGVIAIPGNLNVQFTTNIKTLLFDKLNVKNIKGAIKLADATATLSNLSMDMLEGSMVANGAYSTKQPTAPTVDLNLKVSDFDIHSAYNSFSFIKESLPVAMNCQGKISTLMKFSSTLDKEMSPIMTTANGNGYLESKGILINNNATLDQLATVLKDDNLNKISISYLKINFKMEKGNIVIEPFKTSLANMPTTIYGSQTVDGKIDYTLSMNVDRKYFGGDIEKLLKNVPGSDNIKSVDLDVKIDGTMDKPSVKPDLSKAISSIAKAAEKELKNKAKDDIKKEVMKGLDKLFK